jgi:O-antigen ligase
MKFNQTTSDDYQPLKSRIVKKNDYQTMSSPSFARSQSEEIVAEPKPLSPKLCENEEETNQFNGKPAEDSQIETTNKELSPREQKRIKKIESSVERLGKDRWKLKKGHTLTFIGLYLFTFFVYFRPYELIPGFGFLSVLVLPLALFTLGVYLPTQISNEGTFSNLSTEVKCVLGILALSILTMPLARDFGIAWKAFNDTFIKAVLIFIVMANVVRTRKQLMGLIWIALGIAIFLSFNSINLYLQGNFITEGYRTSAEVKGMFENPNEMSLHLIMMIPIALTLGIGAKNKILKVLYFSLVFLFLITNTLTYSRGGFLGLIGLTLVLLWKLGRNNRVTAIAVVFIFGVIFLAVAPGEYSNRLLSIFDHTLDPVGSASARQENLILSIISTIRNPWGIGIGNSVSFGLRNLETHNAFTQVSSELGVLGLILYLTFLISPFRKLSAIENVLGNTEKSWIFYLAIGLQASIVAYAIGSFFASVAYNWFVYYLVAYTIALRRIYMMDGNMGEKIDSGKVT